MALITAVPPMNNLIHLLKSINPVPHKTTYPIPNISLKVLSLCSSSSLTASQAEIAHSKS